MGVPEDLIFGNRPDVGSGLRQVVRRRASRDRGREAIEGTFDGGVGETLDGQEAGADVLYAPGLHQPEELRELVSALELPLNVLIRPGAPSVSALGALGVKRVSVGGAFAFAAFGALMNAASELLNDGTYGFLELSGAGSKEVRAAFAD